MEYGLGRKGILLHDNQESVLILVLMEYGLGLMKKWTVKISIIDVLILVLMEYGLGHAPRK